MFKNSGVKNAKSGTKPVCLVGGWKQTERKEPQMATELGESVYADWDTDGDLYLFTSEDGDPDDAGAEIWMNAETLDELRKFIAAK